MVSECLNWLGDYDPDLVVVSAGFDGLEGDKGNYYLGHLTPEDYGKAMRMVVEWASKKKPSSSRVVALLEGGYHVRGGIMSDLATAVAYVVRELVEGASGDFSTKWTRDPEEVSCNGAGSNGSVETPLPTFTEEDAPPPPLDSVNPFVL